MTRRLNSIEVSLKWSDLQTVFEPRLSSIKMNWIEHLIDSEQILAIFGRSPNIENARLFQVQLCQDGPIATLNFEIDDYPSNPPKKWLLRRSNRVQLALTLIDVAELSIFGWTLDNIGEFCFSKEDDWITVKFISSSTNIEIRARFLDLKKITDYFDTSRK